MAKDSFPIDAAQVVGLFMESVFYGCVRALVWYEGWFRPWRLLNAKMLFAALLMFTFASMDVAFHLRHNLEAFIWYNGDPIDDFNKTSTWINVIKMGCYVAQTFVGDSILLFRCWIIYDRNWLVVFLPIILWLGTTACGSMTIYVEATMDSTSGQLLNAKSLVPFITSMLCLTLATNVLTTSLIVYRIWRVRSALGKRQTMVVNSPLNNILIVLIESGLMYTFSIVILFALYMASNNGQYGVSNAVVQIIGITFNLIITSVDRSETSSAASQVIRSHASHLSQSPNVPLHMINIQTTIDRYGDQIVSPRKSLESGTEMSVSPSRKAEWGQARAV